jgi:hypothetical protein
MRRLSRSILVLSFVVSLAATNTLHARIINDDGDPRTRPITPPRIVRAIKQVIRFIWAPSDDGGQIIPPKP